MSFDWQKYLELADELIYHQRTPTLEEAYLRSAMSRSYYGIYGIAFSTLQRRGVQFPPTDLHKFVRETFQNSGIMLEKKIGTDMGRLWRDRKVADYDSSASINATKVQGAFRLAHQILSNLRSLTTP